MLTEQIQNELKEAQLSRDEIKVSTLRLLLSEIKNAEISEGNALSDEGIISVISKEAKKRKESVLAFRNGGREESAQKEEAELKILEGYLPSQLSIEELTKLVEEAITELEVKGLINEVGAAGLQDMGKVMSSVMGKTKGRADGALVSALVKEKLS